jgi:inward rectifier potassium channel
MDPPKPRRTRADRITRIGLAAHPLSDIYHQLLTCSWTLLLAGIAGLYVFANAIFALAYYLDRGGIENARPDSYVDHFFFSVQTMATIGYGQMVPHSAFANVLVTIEALFGLVGLAMATGLMFAKFSRPTARVVFSKVAVVTLRDRVPSLMLRLANERSVGLVEATMRLILARDEDTAEGERIRRFHTLDLVRSHTAIFAMTWTTIHPIKETSPLFGETTDSLISKDAELVATVVGTDGMTGDTVHARYTYIASEILFDRRFVDIIRTTPDGNGVIDFRKFHDTVDVVDQK